VDQIDIYGNVFTLDDTVNSLHRYDRKRHFVAEVVQGTIGPQKKQQQITRNIEELNRKLYCYLFS